MDKAKSACEGLFNMLEKLMYHECMRIVELPGSDDKFTEENWYMYLERHTKDPETTN